MDSSKERAICKIPNPRNAIEMGPFLGAGGFYRNYVKGWADTTEPLSRLMGVRTKFKWGPLCQAIFDLIKQKLASTPILRCPISTKWFHLHTNALLIVMRIVLMQLGDERINLPIHYASFLLTVYE